jgi:hypothetical protein
MGMALANGGLGYVGANNAFGGPRAPPTGGVGNQLYVGNVGLVYYLSSVCASGSTHNLYETNFSFLSYLTRRAGKTLRTSSALLEISSERISILGLMGEPKDPAPSSSRLRKMLNLLSVRRIISMWVLQICLHLLIGMYHGFEWYGRTLEVREVSDTIQVLISRPHSLHMIVVGPFRIDMLV